MLSKSSFPRISECQSQAKATCFPSLHSYLVSVLTVQATDFLSVLLTILSNRVPHVKIGQYVF